MALDFLDKRRRGGIVQLLGGTYHLDDGVELKRKVCLSGV